MVQRKDPGKLLEHCETFILRYSINVIWRQVDPFKWIPPNDFYNVECPMPPKVAPVTDPVKFRQNFTNVREYFSENLIRVLHESLAKAATAFVSENKLHHGDVLLRLLFSDSHSKTFELTAKHIIWRRWTVREEATLNRSIRMAEKLTKFVLPSKCTDKILTLLAQHCPHLETLDMSRSFVTDVGLLSVCGIQVMGKEQSNQEQQTPPARGAYCEKTGRWVRASKAKALAYIEAVNNGENPILKRSDRIKDKEISLLAQKMKPFLDETESFSWEGKPGQTFSFSKFGCLKLKKIDLYETVYPKKRFLNDVTKYGITRDAVLAALILLPELMELEWTKLGEILECFQNIHLELGYPEKMLKLSSFTEQRPTKAKLEVALRLCPNITRVSCSLFGADLSEYEARDVDNLFFDFAKIRELELRHLDDTPEFLPDAHQLPDIVLNKHNNRFGSKLRTYGNKLTSLSLTETVSISIPIISLIKEHCQRLKLLDIESYIFNNGSEVQHLDNHNLVELKLLRLGGSLASGDILKYLVDGCPELRVLAYHVYHGEGCDEHVTDQFIQDLLLVNPLHQLVAFHVDNGGLTELTFHKLVENLGNLRQIGQLSEWRSLSEEQLESLKLYTEAQNLSLEIDSSIDGWRRENVNIVF